MKLLGMADRNGLRDRALTDKVWEKRERLHSADREMKMDSERVL